MYTKLILLASGALLGAAAACTRGAATATVPEAAFEVRWDVENLERDSTGRFYVQTLELVGDLRNVNRLAFNQFARKMELDNEADTLVEIVPGYYAIGSARFANATGADTMTIHMRTKGTFQNARYAPEGFHAVMADGSVLPVRLVRPELTMRHNRYATSDIDKMPYGDTIYARNEEISGGKAGIYDVVPSFKCVVADENLGSLVDLDNILFKPRKPFRNSDSYEIEVFNGTMTVYADSAMWKRLDKKLHHNFGYGKRQMPNATITDWPSMPYRGLMLDISRNFQNTDEILKVLDWMAIYGLNVFHFHFSDDEAWRLEIKALPELTEMASRRGYTPGSDGSFLPQIFGGTGRPDAATSNNGFISQDDYIKILRHANDLGIAVIPEIESPGHARAALRAMELRAARTGDSSYIMSEEADTSRYTSAQSFHDNVMNPALEGTYKFVNTVADEIAALHARAGVPLVAIHLGGDEVPRGCWAGSPAVAAMKDSLGISTDKEAHAAFARRLVADFAAKGIPVSGWQEMALNHTDDYNDAVRPGIYSINAWSTLPKRGQGKVVDEIAAAGFPVILSNVDHFYFDLCYSYHPDERGLTWGGVTDEFSALSGYPSQLCTVEGANVLGVQGQIWSETIRDTDNLETMIFPKILGLAERGWNPDTTYTEPNFHAVVLGEIPKWQQAGIAYHVRQPGIKLEDGHLLKINSPYPDAVVRVTFDGSEPTEATPEFAPGTTVNLNEFNSSPSQIRAKLWLNGRPSVTTLLNL